MPADFSYYDILGVSETASAAEIKAAYHSAVLKYHPDVNTAPNAQKLTIILNEAYSVLGDSQRRAAYDSYRRSGQQGPSDEREQVWDLYVCDRCGNFHPHLRVAMFFKVWSIILYTRMNGVGGVLCPDCRSKYAVETATFSAFLGPWGFPWGILYTIRALVASVRGGELPRQMNAELLRHQGVALLQRGWTNEARTALNSSLRFEKNDAVSNLLNEDVFNGSWLLPVPGWLRGQSLSLGLTILAPILVIFVLMMLAGGGSSNSSTQSSAATTQASDASSNSTSDADQRIAQENALAKECGTMHTKVDIRAAYDACVAEDKMLKEDIKVDDAGSRNQQVDIYNDDLAKIGESNGIRLLGLSASTTTLDDSISSSLKDLMQNGVSDDVKSHAERLYDCYVDNNCHK